MITIAIDETGSFEKLDTKGPRAICGVMYDDIGDKNDFKNEAERIREFYRKACMTSDPGERGTVEKAVFPDALHENKDGDTIKGIDILKERINNHIKEFIQYGTYNNCSLIDTARKGSYMPVMIILGDDVFPERIGTGISNVHSDLEKGNLYVHMVEQLMRRCLMVIRKKKDMDSTIFFDMPTRKFVDMDSDKSDLYRVFTHQLKNGGYKFDNIDMGTYKQMIDSATVDIGIRNPVKLELNSIKYEALADTDSMVFKYLADSMCSYLKKPAVGYLQEEKKNKYDAGVGSQLSYDCIKDLSGRNMVFCIYGLVEDCYQEATIKAGQGDIFEALLAFSGVIYGGEQTRELYKDKDIGGFRDILLNMDRGPLKKGITGLKDYLHTNSKEADRSGVMFNILEKQARRILDEKHDRLALIDLFDSGISVYTHLGIPRTALEFYLEFEKLKPPVERYLEASNKACVIYSDLFDFDKAIALGDENIRLYEEEKERLKKFYGGEVEYDDNYARMCSQQGQNYALVHDERAETMFQKSLEMWGKGTGNPLITVSYLLHYYIEEGNEKGYKGLSHRFFAGNQDIKKQLQFIYDEYNSGHDRFSFPFALYVWIKAAYMLYRDEITEDMIDRILAYTDRNNPDSAHRWMVDNSNHPWEIIFKYVALFEVYFGNRDKAKTAMERAKEVNYQEGTIIEAVIHYGGAEYSIALGDKKNAIVKAERVLKLIEQISGKKPEQGNDVIYMAGKYMTYMYH